MRFTSVFTTMGRCIVITTSIDDRYNHPEARRDRESTKQLMGDESGNGPWGIIVLIGILISLTIIFGFPTFTAMFMSPHEQSTPKQNLASTTSPPTISITPVTSGLKVTLNGNISPTAQGAKTDTEKTVIYWGDSYSSMSMAFCNTLDSCSHTYRQGGSYTITIDAVDTLGNTNNQTFQVNVLSPAHPTSSPIQHTASSVVQNTHSSSSPYAVIFSGSTQPTYGNMANYPRILVIGNNAYTMGDASDNYVASNKIPLVSDSSNQDTYITAHGLIRVCCNDQAIIVLRTS